MLDLQNCESPSLSVYYYVLFCCFFSICSPGYWCLWVIEYDETNKTNTTCAEYGKIRRWAYLKSLKVKHQNGFEGYLILTGARSQLTTLIKPQYIALHMSGNPTFQYYSKPEWYFLRCWRNVTYLFFPPLFFSFQQSTHLEVTKSAPCSAAHNLTMWHKHDHFFFSIRRACFINHSRLNGIHF